MDTVFTSALKLLGVYSSQHSESILKREVRAIKDNLAWVTDPETNLIRQIHEILPGDSFEDLIASYAFCIENFHDNFNWRMINKEITERWGETQLDYIKVQGWKRVEEIRGEK